MGKIREAWEGIRVAWERYGKYGRVLCSMGKIREVWER
jgi:hypothetical protein